MKIIIILIGVSLSIAVGFLLLFLWSVRSGQYDDVYTPSVRMLFDDRKKSDNTPEVDTPSRDDIKNHFDPSTDLGDKRSS